MADHFIAECEVIATHPELTLERRTAESLFYKTAMISELNAFPQIKRAIDEAAALIHMPRYQRPENKEWCTLHARVYDALGLLYAEMKQMKGTIFFDTCFSHDSRSKRYPSVMKEFSLLADKITEITQLSHQNEMAPLPLNLRYTIPLTGPIDYRL